MQTPSNSLAIVHYPLSSQDQGTVAGIREHTAPFKGAAFGPAGRDPYNGIMNSVIAPGGVHYEPATVGEVKGVWCNPTNPRLAVSILFLHGGGYTMGSAESYRNFAGHFAERVQTRVFIADYRLGPEHQFPAALEDAHAAYLGLLAEGATQIVIVGDSAGGGLSLSLLSLLQAEATKLAHKPAAAVVMSPWTDLSLSGESILGKADEELYLTKDMLQACAEMYLGEEKASHPQASVLNASLHGLPPLQIHVGTSEILLDDSIRYAQRAHGEGSNVTLHTWEGMPHVFQNCTGVLQAADQSLEIITSFIASHLK